ncbi:MAG: endonuclease VIII [Chloroflexota bacterium]|nr:MAG: endonuclease VIII [Chloroflexota bacterium]
MIELPEATVLAAQINQTLKGKQVRHAIANASPHAFAWYTGDPATYSQQLAGAVIGEAAAYGNHIEIQAGDRLLVISTPVKYHSVDEKRPQKHQLLLDFEDGTAVSCTVQMWGVMLCLREGQDTGLPDYQIAKQKPSPLSDDFDRAYFDRLMGENTATLSAKEFLATKQRIPGLGNGVLQDILWMARIHPKWKLASLQADEVGQMYRAVKTVLRKMTECGGRDTERDLFGRPGGYKTVLSKKTLGSPCPTCGTIIKKEAYLGGQIYYCEGCQPK